MGRRFPLALVLVLSAGCRASPFGDLTTPIDPPPKPDPNGSDGTKRIDGVVCTAPPDGKASPMVNVPAGDFVMGCNVAVDTECNEDELPAHTVTLRAFDVDVTEVSQGQYYACVQTGACKPPTCAYTPCTKPTLPIACINHADAIAYCTWAGKRLPTEAEWEKAARGPSSLKYPWGNDGLDCAHANMEGCGAAPMPVGSLPSGASPYGALDMAGNVVEWVLDDYDPAFYSVSPAADPALTTQRYRNAPGESRAYVGRGGGFKSERVWQRSSVRDDYREDYFKMTLGFRCAK